MTDNASRSRARWLLVLLALTAALFLVVASACGGDDDDDDGGDDGGATATESTDGDDSGDDAGDETPTDGGDDDDDGDAAGILEDIEDLAGSGENAAGVVTYEIATAGVSGGEWTIYTEGDNSRVDFVTDDGGFITITTPEASYTCTEGDGDGICYAGEGGLGSNPFAGLFTQYGSSEAVFSYLELFADVDVDSSSEEIAGLDANCYTASGDLAGDAGTIKWCFSDNGLLLLSQYDLESGGFEMRATAFSEDVPSDAFEPPFDVLDIGQ